MAAKIDHACLEADPSVTVLASQYERERHGSVLCPSKACRCRLVGVPASTRQAHGKQIGVGAFFRQINNAEALGLGHKPNCRFNVERSVKRLVAYSRAITNIDRDAEPMLATAKPKGAEFRLHVLMEALQAADRNAGPDGEDASRRKQGFVGTKFVRSDRVLRPYLRTAKGVLALAARIRDRGDLGEWVRLAYSHLIIPWTDFFFDFDEHGRLYQYLAERQQFRRDYHNGWPVAVVVEVSGRTLKLAQHGSWEVSGVPLVADAGGFGRLVIRPRIYTRSRVLAEKIAAERFALLCAVPTITKVGGKGEPSAAIFINVVSRSQVCRYEPPPKFPSGRSASGGQKG